MTIKLQDTPTIEVQYFFKKRISRSVFNILHIDCSLFSIVRIPPYGSHNAMLCCLPQHHCLPSNSAMQQQVLNHFTTNSFHSTKLSIVSMQFKFVNTKKDTLWVTILPQPKHLSKGKMELGVRHECTKLPCNGVLVWK